MTVVLKNGRRETGRAVWQPLDGGEVEIIGESGGEGEVREAVLEFWSD